MTSEETTLSVPLYSTHNSAIRPLSVYKIEKIHIFTLDCKEKIQLKCHFPQINEAYDIGDNKKTILQLILTWLNIL